MAILSTVRSTKTQISDAARALRQGGVVVFPTETVYGLGANATDALAAARIYEIKGRPHFNPLIVHAPDAATAFALTTGTTPELRALGEKFWPGPLTLVLPKAPWIPGIVTAGLDTVAVRVPNHPVALELLREAGVPIAAPSANLFQSVSPTRVEHARRELGDRVTFYIDGGPCDVGLESTILGFTADGKPELLRSGGLPVEELEKVLGPVARREGGPVTSPGQLEKHYSPRTKVVLSDDPRPPAGGKWGLVCLKADEATRARFAWVRELSPGGSLVEAASRLFESLREADDAGLDGIVAVPVPEHGLGLAINDRLKRASG